MKKNLSICLLIAMLASLASCGGDAPAADTTASGGMTETTTAAETAPPYPEYDLDGGGRAFRMIYFDAVAAYGWSSEIPCDIEEAEITGDVLSDAVYNRNRKIEEMYNISFEAISTKEEFHTTFRTSVLAGASEYDAAFPVWNGITATITEGTLLPLNDLIDNTKPWWDSKADNAFSVSGKTYAMTGDMLFMDKFSDIIIMFNKNMAEDFKLGDIYKMVVDKKWTFDKMVEMCEIVSADLDGNGVYDNKDRIGFSGQNDAMYELFQSSGEQIGRLDKDGVPYFSCNTERAIDVIMDVVDFMNTKHLFTNRHITKASVSEIISVFKENRILFFMRPMQTILELRDMEADFGIIPTPMMDDKQTDYYTSIGYTAAISAAIPSDVKDAEFSAAVLDTMAAEAHYNVNPTLYDMVLGDKITRDNYSTENLDIIFNSVVYDPGCIYDFGGFATKFMKIYTDGSGAVASTIASYEEPVRLAIEKYMDAIK